MESKVIRGGETPAVKAGWGSLQWLVGGAKDAEMGMTFGRVTFKPGQANPVHRHANCDELLFVVQGEFEHTLSEGGATRLRAGDAILIPRNEKHQARNVSAGEGVVVVAYNSAYREMIEE